MTYNNQTGVISETPKTAASANITVSLDDNRDNTVSTLTIKGQKATPTISASSAGTTPTATKVSYKVNGEVPATVTAVANGKTYTSKPSATGTGTFALTGLTANTSYPVKLTSSSTANSNSAISTINVKTLAKRNATLGVYYSSTSPGYMKIVATVKDGTKAVNGGTVSFKLGSYTVSGKTNSSGQVALSMTKTAYAGKSTATVVTYAGNSEVNLKSVSKKVTVRAKYSGKSTIKVTPGKKKATVSVSAIKSGSVKATGKVTIYNGSKKLKTVNLASCKTTTSTVAVPAGKRTIKVVYSGDTKFNTYSYSAKVTVKK